MHIGGLSIFTKTSQKHRYVIASWHSPHSLTWRWSLSFAWVPSGEAGVWHIHKHNDGVAVILALQWLRFDFNTQKPMWYRDMYRRQRDRELA
jgi:hypothetical protein